MKLDDFQMMVVPVEMQPVFKAGAPRVFAEGPFVDVKNSPGGVSPDGRRLLMIRGSGVNTATQLNIVTNWFAELERH